MELARQQWLLARLYTQAALRQRFFRDPDAVLRELGFPPENASPWTGSLREEVQSFARSLQRKRLQDTEKILPITRRLLGEAFVPCFLEYAEGPRPTGPSAGLEEAVAFAEFLQRADPVRHGLSPWKLDLVRYEAAQRRALGVRFMLRHFRYPVHRWPPGPIDAPSPLRRPVWVVWFRLTRSSQLRQVVLSWPRWLSWKMS